MTHKDLKVHVPIKKIVHNEAFKYNLYKPQFNEMKTIILVSYFDSCNKTYIFINMNKCIYLCLLF